MECCQDEVECEQVGNLLVREGDGVLSLGLGDLARVEIFPETSQVNISVVTFSGFGEVNFTKLERGRGVCISGKGHQDT